MFLIGRFEDLEALETMNIAVCAPSYVQYPYIHHNKVVQ